MKVVNSITDVEWPQGGTRHHETLSICSQIQESVPGVISRARSDCTVGCAENRFHFRGLGLPVGYVVLNYAQGVDPEVSYAKFPRDPDSILKCLW